MSRPPYDARLTGNNLRKLRKTKGWTQAELAAQAKRSVCTISALERGEHDMSVETFFALCRALTCLPSELPGNQ